jgi:sortase A
VVLTLAWQEPVSGISAAREQKRLRRELGPTPPRPVAPTAVGGERARRRLAALARRAHGQIRIGDAFGRIEIPALDREYAVIEGADRERLRTGPGHYEDTPFPGEPGTVGVAGHRTTYGAPFRRIDRLEPGDGIVVTVSYARFVYRVERTRAVFPRDVEVKRPVGYDQLIVSASHPLLRAAPGGVRSPRTRRGPGHPLRTGGASAKPVVGGVPGGATAASDQPIAPPPGGSTAARGLPCGRA